MAKWRRQAEDEGSEERGLRLLAEVGAHVARLLGERGDLRRHAAWHGGSSRSGGGQTGRQLEHAVHDGARELDIAGVAMVHHERGLGEADRMRLRGEAKEDAHA